MKPNPKGKAGEDYAAKILGQDGYKIIRQNFHCRWGEIDIIAAKDDIIAFVEVKTRRRGGMITGAEAVTKPKRRRIIMTAKWFMRIHCKGLELQPRFDIFSVTTNGGAVTGHIHLEGAFDADG